MTASTNQKIVVLGAGAWGMAFSTLLAHNGHNVTLWCYEEEVAREIAATRINSRYLPGVTLSLNIHPEHDLRTALEGATLIFEAIPVAYMRSIFESMVTQVPAASNARWVFLSKGIEQKTFFLPSQICTDVFKKNITFAALGGPNFASELVQCGLTATIIASPDHLFAQEVADVVRNEYFKPYLSNDPVGVHVGGALKNIIALAVGIAHGAGYNTHNTTAFLLTQGLNEMVQCAERFGAHSQTIYGLAGLGDMLLTCSSTLSKNMRVGMQLGQGVLLEEIQAAMPALPEGINTLQTLQALIKLWNVQVPLCQAAYATIFERKPFTINF